MEDWKKEMLENSKRLTKEIDENNNEILKIPDYLTNEEKRSYEKIVRSLKESVKYKLSHSDTEGFVVMEKRPKSWLKRMNITKHLLIVISNLKRSSKI